MLRNNYIFFSKLTSNRLPIYATASPKRFLPILSNFTQNRRFCGGCIEDEIIYRHNLRYEATKKEVQIYSELLQLLKRNTKNNFEKILKSRVEDAKKRHHIASKPPPML